MVDFAAIIGIVGLPVSFIRIKGFAEARRKGGFLAAGVEVGGISEGSTAERCNSFFALFGVKGGNRAGSGAEILSQNNRGYA